MHLSQEQVDQFHRDGYVFLPECFSREEAAMLRREADVVYNSDREEVWREKDGSTPRTAFAAHKYNEGFRRLGAHPRLIEPVEQLLDGKLYMHQYKVNAKAAFDGDVWQWHQDFGTWHRDDGMPEPRAMNIAVFLNDVTEFNGPLMFIPGSHREGVLEAGHDLQSTSYPLWTLDKAKITELAERGGIVAPKGPAGSVIMFHGCLVHASSPNISPWGRTIVYLSLCEVSNHITKNQRPEWIAHRDFTPIRALPDDCLQDLVAAQSTGKAAAE